MEAEKSHDLPSRWEPRKANGVDSSPGAKALKPGVQKMHGPAHQSGRD